MEKLKCPVCHNPMNLAAAGIFECEGCAGRWYLMMTFKERLEPRLDEASARHVTTRDPFELSRQCPECKLPMKKRVYENIDLLMDICGTHGAFFDYGEVDKILNLGQTIANQEDVFLDQPEVETESHADRQYVMKQNLFSLNGNYTVTDIANRPMFRVVPDSSRSEKSFILMNLDDHPVATIAAAHGVFNIYRAGSLVACIRSVNAPTNRLAFTIDIPGADDLIAIGDLKAYEFEIHKGKERVAKISKNLSGLANRLRDCYVITVTKQADHILVICSCIVVDLLYH